MNPFSKSEITEMPTSVDVSDKPKSLWDKAGEEVGKVGDKAGEVVGQVGDKAGEVVGQIGEKIGEVADKVTKDIRVKIVLTPEPAIVIERKDDANGVSDANSANSRIVT